jgi:hypothetical protein
MAEPTAEELTKQAQAALASAQAHGALADSQTKVTATGQMAGVAVKELTNFVSGLAGQASFANSALTQLVTGVVNPWKLLTELVNDSKEAIGSIGSEALLTFSVVSGLLPISTDLFKNLGEAGTKAGASIATSFASIKPIIDKLPGLEKLAPNIDKWVSATDQIQSLRLGVIGSAAASGDLNNILERTGTDLGHLSDLTEYYNERIYDTAQASGLSTKTVAGYAANLRQIPGALVQNIENIDGMNNSMTMLDATIKIATAWQMDHAKVVDNLNYAYRNFGTTGKDALSFVSRMAALSQGLHMPMDILERSTKGVGNAFKFMGDNTQSAMSIMADFGPALMKSGIGPDAVGEIVESMTKGVGQLDIAHKAFISGASGGPGGLAGAFKIERMIEEGKMKEVMDMTMNAMKAQFGGKGAVTLEDVDKRPEMAGELLKQREFLKQFGVAASDQQAYKILEAMQKGTELGKGDIGIAGAATPEAALKTSIDRGQTIEQQQNNELIRIANKTERWQQIAAMSAYSTAQKLFGSTGENGDALKRSMQDASLALQTKLAMPETGIGDWANKRREGLGKDIAETRSEAEDFGRNIMKEISPVIGTVGEKIKNIYSTERELQNNTPNISDAQRAELAKNDERVKGLFGDMFGEGAMPATAAVAKAAQSGIRPTVAAPAHAASVLGLPEMSAVMAAESTAGRYTAPHGRAPALPEQVIKVLVHGTVDIKDGVNTIAKATIRDVQAGAYTGIQNR